MSRVIPAVAAVFASLLFLSIFAALIPKLDLPAEAAPETVPAEAAISEHSQDAETTPAALNAIISEESAIQKQAVSQPTSTGKSSGASKSSVSINPNRNSDKVSEGVKDALESDGSARVVVSFSEPSQKEAVLAVAESMGAETNVEWSNGASITADSNTINTIVQNNAVESVENDLPLHTMTYEGFDLIDLEKTLVDGRLALDDPYATPATSRTLAGTGNLNLTGKHQSICVIDSGIYNGNPEFEGRIIAEWNFYGAGSPTAPDDWNHGTRMAGIIAAKGVKMQGIAYEADIIDLRITNSSGESWDSYLYSAIDWCLNNASKYNITTVYIGVGSGLYTGSELSCTVGITVNKINEITSKNITVISPAGHDGNWTHISRPACIANTISVGGVPDGSGTKPADTWNLSGTGVQSNRRDGLLDLLAPGGDGATSTTNTPPNPPYNYTAVTGVGTSVSAAYVAGASLLLREYWDANGWNFRPTGLVNGNIPNTIEYIFKQTGKQIEDELNPGVYYPRLDFYKAVNYEENPPVIALETANGSTVTEGSINFGYNVNDQHSVANCSLFINGSKDQDDVTITEGVTQTFTKTLSAGTYSWKVECYDDSTFPNNGVSETRILNVDEASWSCFGIDKDNLSVCSTHGVCTATDTCVCSDGWTGAQCSTPPTDLSGDSESFALIKVPDAVEYALSHDGISLDGSTQAVCVIDTGVEYNHDELGNCTGTQYLTGNCQKTIGGWNIFGNNNDPGDDNGHGTAVAGIIAADGPTYKGIATKARIVSVKISNSTGGGWTSLIDDGINWCVNNRTNYNITLISFGFSSAQTINASSPCDAGISGVAVNYAVANNISVFAPTGNNITGITLAVSSPACVTNVTAVSAVADGSGSGSAADLIPNITRDGWTPNRFPGMVDIMAPGSFIDSLDLEMYGSYSTNAYGTSFASAEASGAAALLLDYNKKRYGKTLTPAEVNYIFQATGKPIWDKFSSSYYPRIDILAAIRYETNPPIIALESPANAATENEGVITFEYNALDNEFEIANCSLYINGTFDQADTSVAESITQSFTKSLTAGTYNWQVKCYDNSSVPNEGVSETRIINVQQTWSCWGISYDNLSVCSSHGSCTAQDVCVCSGGWMGPQCNTPACTEDWQENYGSCLANDSQLKYYLDSNSCGTINNLPADNGTYITCNYCSYSAVNSTWADWINVTGCQANDTLEQEREMVEYDENYESCYLATLLPSDLWNFGNNNTYYEYRSISCDACTPSMANTTWGEWIDASSCQVNDTIAQERNMTEYDSNVCGEIANTTYFEIQIIACDYCTPDWAEINGSCQPNDTLESWFEDSNSCYAQTGLASDLLGLPPNSTYPCNYANDAPVLDFIADIVINEGETAQITPSATDADNDSLTFSFTSPVNSTGGWATSFTDAGIYNINVSVGDGNGGEDSQAVQITVNNVPVPDLRIKYFLQQSPRNPVANDFVMLSFVIENIGETVANSIYWALDFGNSGSASGTISSLSAGSESSIMVRKTNYTSEGNYTAVLVIDSLDAIAELDETNNNKTRAVSVS